MGDSHSIKEFRELAEHAEHADWMLKMVGSLSRDPSLQTEAKIEVLLRPVKGVASKRIPRGLPEKILNVGVGQLPMLRVSSVWSQGHIHTEDIYPYSVKQNYRISIPETGFQKLVTAFEADEHGDHYAIGQKWSIPKELSGANFVIVPAVDSQDREVELVIPSMVINQAYFARSSFLSRALFDGVLWNGLDSLVKLEECGAFNTAGMSAKQKAKVVAELRQKFRGEVTTSNLDRLFVVKARDHVFDLECYVLARLLSDKFAHNIASSVAWSTMVQRVTLSTRPVHPTGWFPFKGQSTLTVMAYKNPIVSNDRVTRVMVFAIDDCSYQMPFDNLLVQRTNDGTAADEETDISDEDKKPSHWKPKKIKEKENKKDVQSSNDADKDKPVESVDIPFQTGVGSAGIDLLKKRKKQSEYKRLLPVQPIVSPLQSGTSGGMFNRSDIGRTNFQGDGSKPGHKQSPALKANLENFKQILGYINDFEGFRARLRAGHASPGLYPAVTKSESLHDWALIEVGKAGLRYFMVGDIQYGNQHYVLMDTQKRKPKGKSKEGFLYEVVRKRDSAYLLDAELSSMITKLCEAKGRMKNVKSMPYGIVRTWRYVKEMMEKVDEHGNAYRVENRKKLSGLQHRSGGAEKTAIRIVEHIRSHIGET